MHEVQKFNSIVTGGLHGIGKAIVEKLRERGDHVFIFDRLALDDFHIKKLKESKIFYFNVDVSSVDSIKKGFSLFFDFLKDSNFENKNLNLLVNNAGIAKDSLAIRMSESDWNDVNDVNLKGAFFCCQQAIKHMMRQPKGYIINIGSIVGKTGNSGQANYVASKAGLFAVTKTLAMEYGSRNVLVNAIAPGFIKTEMTEKLSDKIKDLILSRISLKRFGLPQDVANFVCFLSGGQADYITGSIIDINGGLF